MNRIVFAAALLAAIIVTSLALASPAPAYVDAIRVRLRASEPKRADAKFANDRTTKQQAINKAGEDAQKAKPADQTAAWNHYQQVQQQNFDAIQKSADETDAAFTRRFGEVLTKLRAERHLANVTAAQGLVLVPGVDLTDEAVKLWDAMDGQALAAENARMRAELDALKKPPNQPAPSTTKKD